MDNDDNIQKNIFVRTRIVAFRTHQLKKGAKPLIKNVKDKNSYQIAQEEYDAGKLDFLIVEKI
ncbi:MAG: hypothetical protein COW47_00925 [Candidatus Huberarchaeum crystalense]|uniref:DNA-directed RNA polymerase n=1 Tax=Huberarchaeum crystalense TaxID=2014257 RepID=A0A2G9LJS8_HUBC1|nr:hypothetical protein [archaeon]OIP20595.1 MAG: hypothetical protein AUJ91_00965 [archaeon CG2_30_31_98]PIN66712.1 MAG: hypothetical protein COW69_00685 [Candidatus Huberarchaeum crystalense]NCS98464.1 hypothetical protein [archaeon]PIV13527.1 MAG: hypothetical protein COS45_02410 [Candidatus Huberarchaeum crystalense]